MAFNMKLWLLLATLALFKSIDCDGSWNYDTLGTDTWPHHFDKCAGKSQSPIDVSSSMLEHDKNLKAFIFNNYNTTQQFNVTNNGHTVVVGRIPASDMPTIGVEGSDLDRAYDLLQFHFHWGYNDFQGSEHTIDGHKYPLEMHLVHKSKDGRLAVLGFMFKIVSTNNDALDDLLNAVNVAKTQKEYKLVNLNLQSILPIPARLRGYYRYSGSLTTPPCTEGVIWNLFKTPINITSKQMTNFRSNQVRLNFREPQRLNRRQVFSSVPVKPDDSGSRERSTMDTKDHHHGGNGASQVAAFEGTVRFLLMALAFSFYLLW